MCAKWIEPKEPVSESKLYRFSKKFSCDEEMSIRVSASTRYKLYVNGTQVLEGPCQGTPFTHYYEQMDVSKYLKKGENIITADILHVADENFTAVMTTPKPMLWLEGTHNGKTIVETDSSWQILCINGIKFFRGNLVLGSAGYFEEHTMPYNLTTLTASEGRDALADSNASDDYGSLNPLRLEQSMLPQMETCPPQTLSVIKKINNEIHLDAGVYTTAKIKIRVKGQKGDKLKITYAECYVKEANVWDFKKEKRDDTTGFLVGPSDYILLNGEIQEVEFYWYKAFRFIAVSCENIDKLEYDISYMPYFYPYDMQGSFSCSDERYNKMWDISVRTLKCCSHEIVADCPHYEQQQYDMDSYLEVMYMLQCSSDTRFAKKIIKDLSHSQQANGLLCANYPSRGCQIIPGFSFYWIMLLNDFYMYSGDVAFAKQYMGVVDKILCYFDNHLSQDGLVQSAYWPYLDWAGNWPNGVPEKGTTEPICAYSMLYSMSLKCAENLAKATGRSGLASEYLHRREILNSAVIKHFWNTDEGYFNDTLSTTAKSRHTAIWAILADIKTGDDAKKLAEKMMGDGVVTCSFSMGYFLFRALEKVDMYDKAFSCFDSFNTMIDLNCTTWCENPDSPRSECHGWSSTPIYEFHRNILGVKPTAVGYSSVEIKPNLGHLEFAQGTVPTPLGNISVNVKKQHSGVSVSYTAPDTITVSVKS